jgi:hypothetical protein
VLRVGKVELKAETVRVLMQTQRTVLSASERHCAARLAARSAVVVVGEDVLRRGQPDRNAPGMIRSRNRLAGGPISLLIEQ